MYLALETSSKCSSQRESGLPDHAASSPETLMPTESQSQSRTSATTSHLVGVKAVMRPIYGPRIHDAWYMDEAIGLTAEEPFHGRLASSSGKRASQKTARSLSGGGQVLLFGTGVDRHGPVQQDGHGTFRSATRLVAFCHFLAPVKSGVSRLQRVESHRFRRQ